MSSTKFVFFRWIGKTRWPPWTLIGWDIFHFSSETAERNSMKLDRKQDLNVLYQVCIFRADQKTKMAALADSSKRWHIVLRCTICGPLGLLFDIAIHVYRNTFFGPQYPALLNTIRGRAFIFHMCIPCDKTFHMVP